MAERRAAARPGWRLLLALDLTVLVVVGSIIADVRQQLGLGFGACFVLTAWAVALAARRAEALVASVATPAVMLTAVLALALFTGHELSPGYPGWRMVPAALGQQLWALLLGAAGALGCAWLRHSGRLSR